MENDFCWQSEPGTLSSVSLSQPGVLAASCRDGRAWSVCMECPQQDPGTLSGLCFCIQDPLLLLGHETTAR